MGAPELRSAETVGRMGLLAERAFRACADGASIGFALPR
jgi:hypothetical protein